MQRRRKRDTRLEVCLSWHSGGDGRGEASQGAGGGFLRFVFCALAVLAAAIVIIGLYHEFIS